MRNIDPIGMSRVEDPLSLHQAPRVSVICACARMGWRAAQSASQTMESGPLSSDCDRWGKPFGSTIPSSIRIGMGWTAVAGDPFHPTDGEKDAVKEGGVNGGAATDRWSW